MQQILERARTARRALLLAGALTLASAPGAFAATLTRAADGTLTYTADPGRVSDVSFAQDPAAPTDTVTVTRTSAPSGSDNDQITNTDPACTADMAMTTFTCTGVTRVVADAADGDDNLSAGALVTLPAALSGGSGSDTLDGGNANDTVTGGAGDDFLSGGAGKDTVDGGSGDDELNNFGLLPPNGPNPDAGDVYIGGGGFDALFTQATGPDLMAPADQSVTLDDQANDGVAGEGDNVRTDVEAVTTFSANDTLVGDDAANSLSGSAGNDTIDGGRGNDQLFGGAGDDTVNAQDGFADVITCGDGNDTANADTLDTVSSDCERVNRRDVGNANDVPEDRAPAVGFTSPANGARLSNGQTTITLDAADDRGVAQVVVFANGVPVCTLTRAPYTCAYQPSGADVGRTALVAVATDTAGQTATDVHTVTLRRFAARGLSIRTTPKRDRSAPFTFTTTGRLRLPTGVTAPQGCSGVVTVQIKAGTKTVSTRRARLSSSCTYRSRVTFAVPRRLRPKGLRILATFGGNAALGRAQSKRVSVRVR